MNAKLQLVTDPYRGYFVGMSGLDQVIIGFLPPGLLLIRFNEQGELLGVSERSLSKELFDEWSYAPLDPLTEYKKLRSFAELQKWQELIQYRDSPISVFPFTLEPRYPVALDCAPGSEREVMANPRKYSAEEIDAARKYVEGWQESFDHAFTWNEEYLIAPDGTVCST